MACPNAAARPRISGYDVILPGAMTPKPETVILSR